MESKFYYLFKEFKENNPEKDLMSVRVDDFTIMRNDKK